MREEANNSMGITKIGLKVESDMTVTTSDGVLVSVSTGGDGVRLYSYLIPKPLELAKANMVNVPEGSILYVKPNAAFHIQPKPAVDCFCTLAEQLIAYKYISNYASPEQKKAIIVQAQKLIADLEKEIG